MSKKTGYASLVISFVLWAAIAGLPFVPVSNKIAIGIVLYALSYVFFFLGGYILGKDAIKQLKIRAKTFFSFNPIKSDNTKEKEKET